MQTDFRDKINILREVLAESYHSQTIRKAGYRFDSACEADLSKGWVLDVREPTFSQDLEVSLADFHKFMSLSMAAAPAPGAYRIIITQGRPSDCPDNAAEAFELRVGKSECELIAVQSDGIRRGLIFLEDRMTEKQFPSLPLGTRSRWNPIVDRITRSPIAAYRWKTGWELLDNEDYYPEEYLNSLMHCGINGIWAAGLFRTLIHTSILPELGPAVHRLEKLKQLVAKAARYGIKVYLFCIEPRSAGVEHPVFKSHPEIRGAIDECLCTSAPLVQEYIRQAVCELFTQVPNLGGLINLFNGERITTCWLGEHYVATCPRCRGRKQVEVLAEDLNCFAEGIRRAGAKAKCLAWTYSVDENTLEGLPVDPELIEKTDPDIGWLGNFEHGGKKAMCGKQISIDEYSLSYTGPSELFTQLAHKAHGEKRTVFAKLQAATTFELSSVPYLPVPGIIHDKFKAMNEHHVAGTMLNWMPGGFPSLMLKAAGEAGFGLTDTKHEFLRTLSRLYWPEGAADEAVCAWTFFERGFQEYPFTNRLFYHGPITRAPAYPLVLRYDPNHADPYNWGFDRDRLPQPFEEDFERWLPPFTVQEVLGQFDRMIHLWGQGLECLERAANKSPGPVSEKQMAVAVAVHVHFCCTRNIIDFFVRRKALLSAGGHERKPLIDRMKHILEDQIRRVAAFKPWLAKEPTLGYQSEILDFSYDAALLDEALSTNENTLRLLNGPEETVIREIQVRAPLAPKKESCPNVDTEGD